MFEGSESMEDPPTYLRGDIVWVKLSGYWWPGEVKSEEDLPSDLVSDFKKPPLAIVKFFDEDSYEYIKNWSNILPYNCDKKSEFIKKGMAGYRAKLSHLAKFPRDIGTAEEKTNGNPNILSQSEFLPSKKINYDEIFGTPSPKKSNKNKSASSTSRKSAPKEHIEPLITHRRFLGNDDYKAYVCIQYPGKDRIPDSDDEEIRAFDQEPEETLSCQSCLFKTKRLGVMLMHNKLHSKGVHVPVKRKNKKPKEVSLIQSESEATPKPPKAKQRKKKQSKSESKSKPADVCTNLLDEWDDTDDELSETKIQPKSKITDTKAIKSDTENEENTESNNVQENKSATSRVLGSSEIPEQPKTDGVRKNTHDDIKNCFDFDEEEEEDDFLFPASVGRKIPRVIPEKPRASISELLELSQKEDDLAKEKVSEAKDKQIELAASPEVETDPTKKEILRVSQSFNRPSTVDDSIDNSFKELMEETELPALHGLTQTLKAEQNFHDARTIKFPDKSGTSAKGGATPKRGAPKKRFVTSFEDFEAGFRKIEDEERRRLSGDKEGKRNKKLKDSSSLNEDGKSSEGEALQVAKETPISDITVQDASTVLNIPADKHLSRESAEASEFPPKTDVIIQNEVIHFSDDSASDKHQSKESGNAEASEPAPKPDVIIQNEIIHLSNDSMADKRQSRESENVETLPEPPPEPDVIIQNEVIQLSDNSMADKQESSESENVETLPEPLPEPDVIIQNEVFQLSDDSMADKQQSRESENVETLPEPLTKPDVIIQNEVTHFFDDFVTEKHQSREIENIETSPEPAPKPDIIIQDEATQCSDDSTMDKRNLLSDGNKLQEMIIPNAPITDDTTETEAGSLAEAKSKRKSRRRTRQFVIEEESEEVIEFTQEEGGHAKVDDKEQTDQLVQDVEHKLEALDTEIEAIQKDLEIPQKFDTKIEVSSKGKSDQTEMSIEQLTKALEGSTDTEDLQTVVEQSADDQQESARHKKARTKTKATDLAEATEKLEVSKQPTGKKKTRQRKSLEEEIHLNASIFVEGNNATDLAETSIKLNVLEEEPIRKKKRRQRKSLEEEINLNTSASVEGNTLIENVQEPAVLIATVTSEHIVKNRRGRSRGLHEQSETDIALLGLEQNIDISSSQADKAHEVTKTESDDKNLAVVSAEIKAISALEMVKTPSSTKRDKPQKHVKVDHSIAKDIKTASDKSKKTSEVVFPEVERPESYNESQNNTFSESEHDPSEKPALRRGRSRKIETNISEEDTSRGQAVQVANSEINVIESEKLTPQRRTNKSRKSTSSLDLAISVDSSKNRVEELSVSEVSFFGRTENVPVAICDVPIEPAGLSLKPSRQEHMIVEDIPMEPIKDTTDVQKSSKLGKGRLRKHSKIESSTTADVSFTETDLASKELVETAEKLADKSVSLENIQLPLGEYPDKPSVSKMKSRRRSRTETASKSDPKQGHIPDSETVHSQISSLEQVDNPSSLYIPKLDIDVAEIPLPDEIPPPTVKNISSEQITTDYITKVPDISKRRRRRWNTEESCASSSFETAQPPIKDNSSKASSFQSVASPFTLEVSDNISSRTRRDKSGSHAEDDIINAVEKSVAESGGAPDVFTDLEYFKGRQHMKTDSLASRTRSKDHIRTTISPVETSGPVLDIPFKPIEEHYKIKQCADLILQEKKQHSDTNQISESKPLLIDSSVKELHASFTPKARRGRSSKLIDSAMNSSKLEGVASISDIKTPEPAVEILESPVSERHLREPVEKTDKRRRGRKHTTRAETHTQHVQEVFQAADVTTINISAFQPETINTELFAESTSKSRKDRKRKLLERSAHTPITQNTEFQSVGETDPKQSRGSQDTTNNLHVAPVSTESARKLDLATGIVIDKIYGRKSKDGRSVKTKLAKSRWDVVAPLECDKTDVTESASEGSMQVLETPQITETPVQDIIAESLKDRDSDVNTKTELFTNIFSSSDVENISQANNQCDKERKEESSDPQLCTLETSEFASQSKTGFLDENLQSMTATELTKYPHSLIDERPVVVADSGFTDNNRSEEELLTTNDQSEKPYATSDVREALQDDEGQVIANNQSEISCETSDVQKAIQEVEEILATNNQSKKSCETPDIQEAIQDSEEPLTTSNHFEKSRETSDVHEAIQEDEAQLTTYNQSEKACQISDVQKSIQDDEGLLTISNQSEKPCEVSDIQEAIQDDERLSTTNNQSEESCKISDKQETIQDNEGPMTTINQSEKSCEMSDIQEAIQEDEGRLTAYDLSEKVCHVSDVQEAMQDDVGLLTTRNQSEKSCGVSVGREAVQDDEGIESNLTEKVPVAEINLSEVSTVPPEIIIATTPEETQESKQTTIGSDPDITIEHTKLITDSDLPQEVAHATADNERRIAAQTGKSETMISDVARLSLIEDQFNKDIAKTGRRGRPRKASKDKLDVDEAQNSQIFEKNTDMFKAEADTYRVTGEEVTEVLRSSETVLRDASIDMEVCNLTGVTKDVEEKNDQPITVSDRYDVLEIASNIKKGDEIHKEATSKKARKKRKRGRSRKYSKRSSIADEARKNLASVNNAGIEESVKQEEVDNGNTSIIKEIPQLSEINSANPPFSSSEAVILETSRIRPMEEQESDQTTKDTTHINMESTKEISGSTISPEISSATLEDEANKTFKSDAFENTVLGTSVADLPTKELNEIKEHSAALDEISQESSTDLAKQTDKTIVKKCKRGRHRKRSMDKSAATDALNSLVSVDGDKFETKVADHLSESENSVIQQKQINQSTESDFLKLPVKDDQAFYERKLTVAENSYVSDITNEVIEKLIKKADNKSCSPDMDSDSKTETCTLRLLSDASKAERTDQSNQSKKLGVDPTESTLTEIDSSKDVAKFQENSNILPSMTSNEVLTAILKGEPSIDTEKLVPLKKHKWPRRGSYSKKYTDNGQVGVIKDATPGTLPTAINETMAKEQILELENAVIEKTDQSSLETSTPENSTSIFSESEIILPLKKSKRISEANSQFFRDDFPNEQISPEKKSDDSLCFPSYDDSFMSTSLRNNIEGLINEIDSIDNVIPDNLEVSSVEGDNKQFDIPDVKLEGLSTTQLFENSPLSYDSRGTLKVESTEVSKCVPPKKKKIDLPKEEPVSAQLNNSLQDELPKAEEKLTENIPQAPKKKIQKLFESSQSFEKSEKSIDLPLMSPLAKKKSFLFHHEEFDHKVDEHSQQTHPDPSTESNLNKDSIDNAGLDQEGSSNLSKIRKKRKSSSHEIYPFKKEKLEIEPCVGQVEIEINDSSSSVAEALKVNKVDNKCATDEGTSSKEFKNEQETIIINKNESTFDTQTSLNIPITHKGGELCTITTSEVTDGNSSHTAHTPVKSETELVPHSDEIVTKKEEIVAPLEPLVPSKTPNEPELVSISVTPTVMSEKDLADAQVEITTSKVISERKPTTSGTFSMDFSEAPRSRIIKQVKKHTQGKTKVTETVGTEFTSKAMLKEFVDNRALVSQPNAYVLKSELLDILEGNSNSSTNSSGSEQKFKTSFDNYDKKSIVQGIIDFEDAIPSQIVLSNKVSPESVLLESPKLLERLSLSEASKPKAHKVVIQSDIKVPESLSKTLISKMGKPTGIPKPGQKIVIKTSRPPASQASKIVGSKPIILSEQIIRPANSSSTFVKPAVQSQGVKRQYEDIEDVETAFIIPKIAKKAAEEEIVAPPAPEKPTRSRSSKNSGKAKIIQQTIITPKGEIIPQASKATTAVTQSSQLQTVQIQAAQDDSMFDINSMPIVLSDDLLTPESIQNMPVVLSEDVLPQNTAVPAPKSQEKLLATLPKKIVSALGTKQIIFKTTQSVSTNPVAAKHIGKARILSTSGASPHSKLSKPGTTALLATGTTPDGKPAKYVLVPPPVAPATTQVKTVKQTIIKKPPVVQSKIAPSSVAPVSDPANQIGNKIMIVTNAQGQQTRVVLTPQQHKAFMQAQTGTKTKTIIKSAIPKALLESAAGAAVTAGPSGIVPKSVSVAPQVASPTVSSHGGLLMPAVKSVKTPVPAKKAAQRAASKPQKTILIKNQLGQTVRKIQGTDDADLDRQVAEQLEAIKASARLQQANKAPEIINYTNRQIPTSSKSTVRRPFSKKVDVAKVKTPALSPQVDTQKPKETVPALAPLSPQPRISPVQTQNVPKQAIAKKLDPPTPTPVSKSADAVLQKQTTAPAKSDNKPATSAPPKDIENKRPESPLRQVVIQDGLGNLTTVTVGQILAIPSETVDGQPQSYMLVTVDESGNLTPLNNDALMSLDPSLGAAGDLNNVVLQVDQGQGTVTSIKPAETNPPAVAAALVEEKKVEEKLPEPPKPSQLIKEEVKVEPVELSKPQEVPLAVEQQIVIGEGVLPGDSGGQQLIVTGDPIATQKFLESLSDGTTDLANILANAEGGSVLIQADGQQILIRTNPTTQPMMGVTESTESAGNPMFATHKPNQDILAAALANTDVFQPTDQHNQSASIKGLQSSQLSPGSALYPMHVGNVLETSLTLSSPIMTPLEVPSTNSKKIDDEVDILSQVPKNVDLPITITDPNISQTVAQQTANLMELDIHSPSYSYSLQTLEESVGISQKSFGSSMPLLTEDLGEVESNSSSSSDRIRVRKGLDSVPSSFSPNFGSLPMLSDSIESSREEVVKTSAFGDIGSLPLLSDDVIEDSGSSIGSTKPPRSSPKSIERDIVDEGLSTLGGEMCSSLSEPPPDMFDLSSMTHKEEEISSDVSSIPEPETLSMNSENSGEIPIQPPIVASLSDLKRSSDDSDGSDDKRPRFD